MPDSVDRILQRYESQGFDKIVKEQQAMAAQYDKTAKAQDKVNTSATKLGTKLTKLGSFGRDLRQAGGFLGNDTIMALGNFADGLSDVGQSIDAVTSKGNKLGKLVGVLGAVVGGVGLGASVYDATIGKLQGGNTAGNILDQLGKFAGAGFNQEQLAKNEAENIARIRFQVESAQIDAKNAIFNFKESLGKNDPIVNALAAQTFQAIGSALNATGLGLGGNATNLGNITAQAYQRQPDARKSKIKSPAELAMQAYAESQQTGGEADKIWNDFVKNEKEKSDKRAEIENRHSAALQSIEQDTAQKRAQLAQDYAQQALQADQEYYANRQKIAEEYGIETGRLEAEHQKNIRRMQEDHQGRLKKLVESRDALAVEDEIEQYNKERNRAEEDYQDMMNARQADYAAQLRELERSHNEQRNERQRAYQQQVIDLNQQAQQRRQQEAAQYALLLRDIVNAFVNARNEFAAGITNNTTNTTNNNQSPTVNINGAGGTMDDIQSAVYGAITGAFGG